MEYQSNNSSNGNSAVFTASNGAASGIASNPASGSENRKPATAQQLVRENMQYLVQQLEAGHSEALTAFLDAMAHFRNYSFGNVLLIARQKPQATNVAGMWAWNQLGRRVKRGEKGIAILAPMVAKTRKDEAKSDGEDSGKPSLLGFRRVYVWDESQTEGAPLPELDKVTGEAGVYLDRLREYVNAQGITLEYNESIAPALGMAFGNTIRLLPGQTDAETFTTLVHELSHLILKHTERRTATTKTVRETESYSLHSCCLLNDVKVFISPLASRNPAEASFPLNWTEIAYLELSKGSPSFLGVPLLRVKPEPAMQQLRISNHFVCNMLHAIRNVA